MTEKRKIAILGGGLGAMTAAFELTCSPDWPEKLDITVYQMGWRLGGKGASGRDLDKGSRIEEHGLHIWFGFYENAFELIRLAYEEVNRLKLTPGSPFTDFTKAFTKQSICSMVDPDAGEGDQIWTFWFPMSNELPGADLEQENLQTPWDDVVALVHWLLKQWDQAAQRGAVPARSVGWFGRVLSWLRTLLFSWEKELLGFPLHMAARQVKKLSRDPRKHTDKELQFLIRLLDEAAEMVGKLVQTAVAHATLLRRLFVLIDAVAAVVRGLIEDRVLFNGYDSINQYDLREWLKRHGCLSAELATIGAYDACFAYENGDFTKPRIEAGTALRGALRTVLSYRGAALWRMNAGMGDTIFSPLYLLLKQRGVKFEFFHRVENLGLSADRTSIESIEFAVQATVNKELVASQGGYSPLVTIGGIPCWPNRPLYGQLDQGEAMNGFDLESAWTTWNSGVPNKRLLRGADFDEVVLGISLGALPFICKELIAANQAWKNMVEKVGTVQTQAVQLWLRKTAAELGFSNQFLIPIDELAIVSGHVEPFDTYADMSQVLDKETTSASAGARQVAYFCNVLPDAEPIPAPFTDPGFPARERERVRNCALKFFRESMKPLWPAGLNAAGELDWDVLADPSGRQGAARLDAQFLRANIDPSERYVLSLPGTSVYRLHPAKSGFQNLTLAGDWTFNFLNVGCVEAAVISGRLASRALCGCPKNIKWAFGSDVRTQ
jgi:uncharacterized protein with NAD-binding domain and iron-sulfur cluster